MLALLQTIDLALSIYTWIIIASAVFSWLYAFNVVNSRNQVVSMIWGFTRAITEPALKPIRRIVPPIGALYTAAIVAAAQTDRSPKELQAAARASLPRSLRPKRLLALPKFPVTARGKTDARTLAAALAAYKGDDTESSTSKSSS